MTLPNWRRGTRRARIFVGGAIALAVALPGAAGAADTAESLLAAANPSPVSKLGPNHLIQSTGNLYWTWNHCCEEFGPNETSASVLRASKSAVAGDPSRILYSESRNDGRYFSFADITYAKVGGTWYGYFVANYETPELSQISQIKRVPLAGGPATILATSPRPIGGRRDLTTDGTYLYWTDEGGLRRMSVVGGIVTTLASGSLFEKVGLDAGRVYFTDGPVVRSVPKAGGVSTAHVNAAGRVTALHVRPSAGGTTLYWGESNAAVRSRVIGGATTTHQNSMVGERSVTSVFFDGARVLWTDCINGGSCGARKRENGKTTTVKYGGLGAGDVQGDATAMFWGGEHLMRFVH